jgi:hypothetical protein
MPVAVILSWLSDFFTIYEIYKPLEFLGIHWQF